MTLTRVLTPPGTDGESNPELVRRILREIQDAEGCSYTTGAQDGWRSKRERLRNMQHGTVGESNPELVRQMRSGPLMTFGPLNGAGRADEDSKVLERWNLELGRRPRHDDSEKLMPSRVKFGVGDNNTVTAKPRLGRKRKRHGRKRKIRDSDCKLADTHAIIEWIIEPPSLHPVGGGVCLLSTAIFFFPPALRRHSPRSSSRRWLSSSSHSSPSKYPLQDFFPHRSRLPPPLKASSPIAQDCVFPVPLIKTLLALSLVPVPHALCSISAICGTFSGFPYFVLPRDLAACASQDLLSSIRLILSNTCLGNAYAARGYDSLSSGSVGGIYDD
ncbi:hypothetical protein DFH09DRAFT_1106098 [Mycena vulgaris]|nr:hypothetical protein DFH09DRAFT_1106098 [Mycena vulgaris]